MRQGNPGQQLTGGSPASHALPALPDGCCLGAAAWGLLPGGCCLGAVEPRLLRRTTATTVTTARPDPLAGLHLCQPAYQGRRDLLGGALLIHDRLDRPLCRDRHRLLAIMTSDQRWPPVASDRPAPGHLVPGAL
jgi:hypothetical protein